MINNINLLKAKCLLEAANILNEAGAQQKQTGIYRDRVTKINQQIDKLKRNNGSKEEIEKLQSKAKELQSWLDKYGTPSRREQKINNRNSSKNSNTRDDTINTNGRNMINKKYQYEKITNAGKSSSHVDTTKTVRQKKYDKLTNNKGDIINDILEKDAEINGENIPDSHKAKKQLKYMAKRNISSAAASMLHKRKIDKLFKSGTYGLPSSYSGKKIKYNKDNSRDAAIMYNKQYPNIHISDKLANGEQRISNASIAHELGHYETIGSNANKPKSKYFVLGDISDNTDKYGEDYLHSPVGKYIYANDKETKKIITQLIQELSRHKQHRKAMGKGVSAHLNLKELAADSHAVGSGNTTLSALIDNFKQAISETESTIRNFKRSENTKYDHKKYDDFEEQLDEMKFRIHCLTKIKDKLK